jgi:RNA polymerase sigma factor (sigma-70 family)
MADKLLIIDAIRRYKTGDENAFGDIFELTKDELYGYGRMLTGDDMVLEDALQETYIKIYRNLGALRDEAAFFSWSRTVLRNEIYGKLRQGSRETTVAPLVDDEGNENDLFENIREESEEYLPGEDMGKEVVRDIVNASLDDLSDVQRQTVVMYYYDEMSVRDIALMMGCSEGTVKSRLNSSRSVMKEGLTDYEKKHGIALHGVLPFVLLHDILSDSVAAHIMPTALGKSILSATGWSTVTSSVAAGTSAGAAAGATVKGGISGKIVAVIIAGALAVGGGAFGAAKIISDHGSADVGSTDKKTESPAKTKDADTSVLPAEAAGQYSFSSGVGAWEIHMDLKSDGTFTWEGHDTDMGLTGEGYPNGTVWVYSGKGRFEVSGKEDEYTYKLKIKESEETKAEGTTWTKEGVRYVAEKNVSLHLNSYELILPGRDMSDREVVMNWLDWRNEDHSIVGTDGIAKVCIILNTDEDAGSIYIQAR